MVRISRTWSRLAGGRLFLSRRSWWTAFDAERMGIGLCIMTIGLSAPAHATLWGVRWGHSGIRWVGGTPGWAVALSLTGLWLLGAWVFGGLLGRRIAEPVEPRSWFRLVRAAVVGIPGLGLGSIPLWRHAARCRPDWAYTGLAGKRHGAMGNRVRPDRIRSPLDSGQIPLLVWVAGLVVLTLGVVWLAAPSNPVPSKRIILFTVAAGLHGLGLLGTVLHVRALRRRGGCRVHYLFAAFWLLPQPLSLVALVPVALDPNRSREKTLAWAAYASHNRPDSLSRWRNLKRSVRSSRRASSWWVRWLPSAGERPQLEPTSVDRQLLRLGGVKQSLLLIDGMALGWIALQTDEHAVALQWVGPLFWFLLAIAGGGFALVAGGIVSAWFGEPPRPLGELRQVWSGTVASGILDLGIAVGGTLATGDHANAGRYLVSGALGAMSVLTIVLALQIPLAARSSGGFDLSLWWCAPFVGLIVVAGLVVDSPVAAVGLLFVALSTPTWHWLLYRAARSRFENSLRRGESEPSDHDPGTRRTVLVAGATLALPLGGLAVPLWLRARDRRNRRDFLARNSA